jgi:hypothetical protein
MVYGATRAEAQARLDEALGQSANGIPVGGATVAAFITEWLHTVAVHRLRVSTFETYRHCVEAFIVPGLRDKLVHQLTTKDVRAWIDTVRGQCQCCAQGWDARTGTSGCGCTRRPSRPWAAPCTTTRNAMTVARTGRRHVLWRPYAATQATLK